MSSLGVSLSGSVEEWWVLERGSGVCRCLYAPPRSIPFLSQTVKLLSSPIGSNQDHAPQMREIQEFGDSKIARKA
jgi:hypothetical protein